MSMAKRSIPFYDGVRNPHTWFRDFENLGKVNGFAYTMLPQLPFWVENDIKSFLSAKGYNTYELAKKGICEEYWGSG